MRNQEYVILQKIKAALEKGPDGRSLYILIKHTFPHFRFLEISHIFYSKLLCLFPSEFYEEFGEQIILDFQEKCCEAYEAGGYRAWLPVLWQSVWSFVGDFIGEWLLHYRKELKARLGLSSVLLLLQMVFILIAFSNIESPMLAYSVSIVPGLIVTLVVVFYQKFIAKTETGENNP